MWKPHGFARRLPATLVCVVPTGAASGDSVLSCSNLKGEMMWTEIRNVDAFDQGDFTWNSMSGRSVRLRSVPIQSLSELERARLQEVAFYQLQQDCDLSCQITIPKESAK
eukprot:bmy_00892T0